MALWKRRWLVRAGWMGLATTLAYFLISSRHEFFEKRVAVVAEGRLIRGAWQRPVPLRRIIERERIRTIVTLTAINQDDPKYVDQSGVVDGVGVDWVLVPMRGSTATIEQMAEAADLLADPDRQPVFFHCVAGHHRTSLVHAAYRIRHEGYSAERAWRELADLPWTRPEAEADRADRRLIEAFAQWCRTAGTTVPRKESRDEGSPDPDPEADRPAHPRAALGRGAAVRLALGQR
ncbi:hypothetical protein BH23PLA1_BH23PLA1_14450 [soil metagenome]